MDEPLPLYGIDDLAERAGVSRRTVRYYVQQGLLAAPRGLGRGKHYTAAHLAALIRIRALQEAGTPLAMIATALGVSSPGSGREVQKSTPAALAAAIESAATPTLWTHIALADGVVLQIRDRVFSEQQRRALTAAVRTIVRRGQGKQKEKPNE